MKGVNTERDVEVRAGMTGGGNRNVEVVCMLANKADISRLKRDSRNISIRFDSEGSADQIRGRDRGYKRACARCQSGGSHACMGFVSNHGKRVQVRKQQQANMLQTWPSASGVTKRQPPPNVAVHIPEQHFVMTRLAGRLTYWKESASSDMMLAALGRDTSSTRSGGFR